MFTLENLDINEVERIYKVADARTDELYNLLGDNVEQNDEWQMLGDIWSEAGEVIHWFALIGTDADTYTGGEATRRTKYYIDELNKSLEAYGKQI